jgi:hypothetical protein
MALENWKDFNKLVAEAQDTVDKLDRMDGFEEARMPPLIRLRTVEMALQSGLKGYCERNDISSAFEAYVMLKRVNFELSRLAECHRVNVEAPKEENKNILVIEDDKRFVKDSHFLSIERISEEDWHYCKFCKKKVPTFVLVETWNNHPVRKELNGTVAGRLRSCWECGAGLKPLE